MQYKLERMVNELEDLESRGIFSRGEIAEIVKQRRKFEYRLKRPSPLKQDYLAYIDYEKSLDALRLLRRKAVARQLKEKGNKKTKKSVSDFAGISRIIEIYRLATNRFKGDIQLWFKFLEFCRERRNGHMKKVLAQVIRFHPKVAGVWIYAAAWEFDTNLNITAARALMQSGLRACPASEDLWVEYLRMELTYLNKLKARKVALGEDEGTLIREHRDPEDKNWENENKELFMALDGDKKSDKALDILNRESKKNLDLFREQGLSVLQAIYRSAVEALPTSFSLRTRFLEILEAIDLAHSEEMQQEILADIKKDFSKEPEYWDWLARLETAGLGSTQDTSREITPEHLWKAIQVYEEALRTVPSSAIFSLYTNFLMDVIVNRNRDTECSGLSCALGHNINPVSHLLTVFEKAESMGFVTEDLACQHISFVLEMGRIDEARKLAEKLCNGKLFDAVQLWVLRLSIEMRRVKTPGKSDLTFIFDLLQNVLREVPIAKAERLWLMALKFFANQRLYFDKLVETSMTLLTKDGGSDDGFSLSTAIINFVLQRNGVQSARDLYKRYLALPRPGLALYRRCIELELNLTSAGEKDCLVRARKLYEAALATYDQDVSLWQDYYSMECKMGTSETAAAVHWRARKTLKGNATFLS